MRYEKQVYVAPILLSSTGIIPNNLHSNKKHLELPQTI